MPRETGSLTVIAGSMFAGKTEELIRRVRRASYAWRSVQVFKSALDTRSENTEIRSHDGTLYEAHAVSASKGILSEIEASADVVAIEEAQFFDDGIVEVCEILADRGYEVMITGLDMDFRGQPFGPMPALLAVSDEVVKLRAICARCGRDASRSQRLMNGEPGPRVGVHDTGRRPGELRGPLSPLPRGVRSFFPACRRRAMRVV